jgi:hypothetical protein
MIFTIFIFAIACWLGLYLINRDLHSPRLRYAGLGLVTYALAWGCTILSSYAPIPTLGLVLTRWSWSFFALSTPLWAGAMIFLLSEEISFGASFARIWHNALLPIIAFCFLLSVSTASLFHGTPRTLHPGALYFIFNSIALLPLLAVICLGWQALRSFQPKRAGNLLLPGLLFLALSMGLLLFPQVWPLHTWILFLVGIDLLILGGAIIVLDAFDQGEALLPDLFRSFDFSLGAVILFAGQVLLVILLSTGLTFPLLVLFLTTIAAAIAVQTFSRQAGTWLDKLALAHFPQIRQARAELREVVDTLPRARQTPDLEALDETEFDRLTRHAFSHFGDLSRLAASPLTHLPQIDIRLAGRGARDDTLGRVTELKALLAESIQRLKPQQQGDFGTSDEWHYYNALYFSYVVGLKPYSRRRQQPPADPVASKALEWFHLYVPERTLHNWQTAATKLIAQDLREMRNF